MSQPSERQRSTRFIFDVLVGYLALHGAFNLVLRTSPEESLKIYAGVVAIGLIAAVVASRLLKPRA